MLHRLKYILFFVFLLLIAGTACKKDDPDVIAAKDRKKILSYLAEHELDYTELEAGVFVVIENEGTGGHPHENSTVRMNYEGYLLDGTPFDYGSNAMLNLNLTVRGFRIGVMAFQKGGKGIIIVPSAMGYGQNRYGAIPRNSVLVFEVDIINF